jgi:hypothetical protein
MKKTVCMIVFLLAQAITYNVMAQDKLEFSGNCTYPDRPSGTDGSAATEAQMIAFQKDMKDYLAKGNDFLSCLDKEEGMMSKKATGEQKEEFKAQITMTYNAVVDEMNAIADQFNTALKAYKNK